MPNQSTRDTTNGDIRLYPTGPTVEDCFFRTVNPKWMEHWKTQSTSLFVSDNWLNSISSRFEQTRSTIHQTMNRSKLTRYDSLLFPIQLIS